MNLKSFGCSFIFGTDLRDDGKNGAYATASCLTWPSLLANNLNYKYTCYARPGAGNLQILENILNQTADDTPAVFVIGWTWIDRFDYVGTIPRPGPGTTWSTIMPIDTDDLATVYYRDLHSEYSDKLRTLAYIKLAIDTLKQKNIPFIMTYMDDLIFDQKWHVTAGVLELQEYIRPYMLTFEGKNFLEWSKSKGFEISPTWHPLEPAHQSAFEYVKNQRFL